MKRRTRKGRSPIVELPEPDGFILARLSSGELRATPLDHFAVCRAASGLPPGSVLRSLLGLGPGDSLAGLEVFWFGKLP